MIAFLTSFIGYFNEYTRISMTELIRKLVGKCGPADDSMLCDYIKNVTNAKDSVIAYEAKDGVYESIWKLALALIFYLVMIVITFGIKVPCGLFVPSLTIGAITGRLVGTGFQLLQL
jgi:chloride channel 3/4/5